MKVFKINCADYWMAKDEETAIEDYMKWADLDREDIDEVQRLYDVELEQLKLHAEDENGEIQYVHTFLDEVNENVALGNESIMIASTEW